MDLCHPATHTAGESSGLRLLGPDPQREATLTTSPTAAWSLWAALPFLTETSRVPWLPTTARSHSPSSYEGLMPEMLWSLISVVTAAVQATGDGGMLLIRLPNRSMWTISPTRLLPSHRGALREAIQRRKPAGPHLLDGQPQGQVSGDGRDTSRPWNVELTGWTHSSGLVR